MYWDGRAAVSGDDLLATALRALIRLIRRR